MNADPKGMARLLTEAADSIDRATRGFRAEVNAIRLVAAALQNVIEEPERQGPSIVEAELQRVSELLVDHFGETTRTSVSEHLADVIAQQKRQGPSDGWDALTWCGNNAADFNRHKGVCYVTWIGDDMDAHTSEGATWEEAITNAMADEKAVSA